MNQNSVNDGDAEDRKAMLSLLEKHGLLLELPDATLDRCIGSNDKVKQFHDQILNRSTVYDAEDYAKSTVTNVKRLAALPGGRIKAMDVLVETAETYISANENQNPVCDSPPWNGTGELSIMDELMTDLIRTHYISLQCPKNHWKPLELLQNLEENGPVYNYNWADVNTFDGSIELLQTVLDCCIARTVAYKVVGHKLPPELVEMVREFICSDKALRESSKEAIDPWWRTRRWR